MIARRAVAVAGSLALHGLLVVAGLSLAVPRPVPEQDLADSAVTLATMRVPQRDAARAEPKMTDVAAGTATGLRAAGQGVVQRRAQAIAPEPRAMAAMPAGSAVIAPRATAGAALAARPPGLEAVPSIVTGEAQAALAPPQAVAMAARPETVIAVAQRPGGARTDAVRLPATVQGSVVAVAASVRAQVAPLVTRVASVPRRQPAGPAVTLPEVTLAGAQTSQEVTAPAMPDATKAPARAPDAPVIGAALDWSGAGVLDAPSLETVAAFLRPGTADGQEMRDGLAATLAAPDCARIQTEFDARTGRITLRGHVRDDSQRAPLLEALGAQLGAGLPLDDQLLVLSAPQCGVLTALDRLDLPQSDEHFTDPMVVGNTTQAQIHSFREAEGFELRLTGADYPAYVYVDYFDGAGNVIHLVPSAPRGLELLPAGAELKLGERDLDVTPRPPLDLRIAAPFGQDIAVAVAASRPLYDGLRPFSEPAGPYLAFLTARIAALRANDRDFRGEWAYLFVITRAGE